MPSRLAIHRVCRSCQLLLTSTSTLRPLFQPSSVAVLSTNPHSRNASILSSLSDNPGAYSKKIRRGRGPSSGKGKTSGRGHKGQKQHGKVPAGFNGGQTPLEVVHGKRGFKNVFSLEMSPLNLDRVQTWIDQGRLDPSRVITLKELCASRCLHRIKDGVKLLARGKELLRTPINIVVSRASTEAIATVEAVGGTIQTRFYNRFAIRRIKNGLMDPVYSRLSPPPSSPESSESKSRQKYPFRLPDPASRKELEYYRDPAHRGYLSYQLQEGQGPSLFWKTPGLGSVKKDTMAKEQKKKSVTENRVW